MSCSSNRESRFKYFLFSVFTELYCPLPPFEKGGYLSKCHSVPVLQNVIKAGAESSAGKDRTAANPSPVSNRMNLRNLS